MAKDSHIEWTHHTFNPWLGCVEVSPACDHCYARTLVTGRMGKDVWGKDKPRPETSENYWHQPFAWDRAAEAAGERHRVFCGSLCDVMEDRRDLDRIRGDLYKLIESTPHLDWLLLTKRPQNFRRFLPADWIASPRPNVWGMTTVESAEYLWRVAELLNTPFAVRGLSCEPLLGPLDISRYLQPHWTPRTGADSPPWIDWVIVGGESGPGARPCSVASIRSIVQQCKAAGVRVFVKQTGRMPSDALYEMGVRRLADSKGGDPSEWPKDLRIRELPASMCAPAHNRSGGPDPHDPQWFDELRPGGEHS